MTGNQNHKPAIAIVETIGSHGGIHFYTDNQAEALLNQGHPTTLYSLPSSTDTGARYSKVNTFVGIYGSSPKLLRGLRLLRDLARSLVSARLAGTRILLFHLYKMDGFELYTLTLARLLGMKSMAIVHDVARLDQTNERPKLSAIAKVTDLLIVHNAFSEASLLAALGDTPANVKVIPSGNYIAQFPDPPSKNVARGILNLPEDKLIILFFGNPRREKGLHVLLEAMMIHRDDPRLLLVVAGKMKASEEAEHRNYVKENGLDQRVRFDIGHVSDEAVPSYYRAADVVILPYLRIYESAIALMSMSLERPVIASDLPPLREVVDDNARGLLFPTENASALAACIGEILRDPSRVETLGLAASHYAAHERHWDVTGKMLSSAAGSL